MIFKKRTRLQDVCACSPVHPRASLLECLLLVIVIMMRAKDKLCDPGSFSLC